jgi:anthranilate synthase/aminodeoxychorismate synthase-like glutamine amidotransferase
MTRLLLVDNYDSFTYNLVQAFLTLGADVDVRLNDRIGVADALDLAPTHLVISPGPGAPSQAGASIDLIRAFCGRVPILGVCLGHQALVEAFGGRIVRAHAPVHGKTCLVKHDGLGLFSGLPREFAAGRYHSLVADPAALPPTLVTTATAEGGEIMGVRHREHRAEGVQFHPESILTLLGPRILRNFLAMTEPRP